LLDVRVPPSLWRRAF